MYTESPLYEAPEGIGDLETKEEETLTPADPDESEESDCCKQE